VFSGLGALSHSDPIFFFVDSSDGFHILALYMARIYDTAKSTLALRQRKRFLLSQLQIRPDSLRASLVERFSRCGKANCHCHHGGDKHGPFYYLTQCLAVGKVNKFLLKTDAQQQAARSATEHYRRLQEQLEELSQINAELLRREEPLGSE
jgi:hypothetical protein